MTCSSRQNVLPKWEDSLHDCTQTPPDRGGKNTRFVLASTVAARFAGSSPRAPCHAAMEQPESGHGHPWTARLSASEWGGCKRSNKPYILSILSYMHVIYENIHKRVFCYTLEVRVRFPVNTQFPFVDALILPRVALTVGSFAARCG